MAYIYCPGKMAYHYVHVASCCAWNWGALGNGGVYANPKTLTIHGKDDVLFWKSRSTVPSMKLSFPNFTIYANVDLVKMAEVSERGLGSVEWVKCVCEDPSVQTVLNAVAQHGVVVIAGTEEQDYVAEDYSKIPWISSFRTERQNESSGNHCILWILIRGNEFEHSVVEDIPEERLSSTRL